MKKSSIFICILVLFAAMSQLVAQKPSDKAIEKSMLKPYPALLKYHDFVANDARVKAYYDREDETRWVFQPGAFSDV